MKNNRYINYKNIIKIRFYNYYKLLLQRNFFRSIFINN